MWKQTLKKINHQETPYLAIKRWGGDPSSLKLINNQINCIYYFTSAHHGHYLRITHPTIRSVAELQASIDFQIHLHKNAVRVCQPVLSHFGHYIEAITQNDLIYLATVVKEVQGEIIHFSHKNKNIYYHWGQELAKLHQAAKKYNAKNNQYKTWKECWEETAVYIAHEDDQMKKEFAKIDTFFQSLSENEEYYSLIHGDHRTGNVLLDRDQVHFIDFDEPIYHWVLADIAMPLLEVYGQPLSSWQHQFNEFINGYCSIFPISEQYIKNIQYFIRMKSLEIYLWCKNNWHEKTAPGGKPRDIWLSELRNMVIHPVF